MMLDVAAAALAGVSLGALSSAHCTLMCGPVALVSRAHGRTDGALAYFAGRFASYVAIGALVGGLGSALLTTRWASTVERILSLVLVASLLWAAFRAWSDRPSSPLVSLGRGPRPVGISRVLARLAEEPLLLGAATVFLPCATLFAAVGAAAATGSALGGAVLMSAFAVVTGVAVVGLGGVLARVLSGRSRRVAFTVMLVLGALLTLMRPTVAHGPSCPLHAGVTQ
ncbi:MAG TPA: sulfite exporter TauE/SafE family protein [Polyangiales bacterium]